MLPAIRAFFFSCSTFKLSVMTQYIIQNDNEEYMAAFSKKRITWTKAPECAKTFDSREAANTILRKINFFHNVPCWLARVVRD